MGTSCTRLWLPALRHGTVQLHTTVSALQVAGGVSPATCHNEQTLSGLSGSAINHRPVSSSTQWLALWKILIISSKKKNSSWPPHSWVTPTSSHICSAPHTGGYDLIPSYMTVDKWTFTCFTVYVFLLLFIDTFSFHIVHFSINMVTLCCGI